MSSDAGAASPYARFFDIDWDAPALHGRVLLPVLGAPRAELLADGGSGGGQGIG